MKWLETNFSGIRNYIEQDMDWLNLNVGDEGKGKSTLSIILCKLVDPTFNVKRIVFTPMEFQMAVMNAKQRQAILLDEGSGLLSRRAMSKENVEIMKLMNEMRIKNLFVIINIPDPFQIDKNVLGRRARSMTRVISSVNNNGVIKRGLVAFYSREQMNKMQQEKNQKQTIYPEPDWIDTFPQLDGKLWKEYDEKQRGHKKGSKRRDVLKRRAAVQKKLEKYYTLRDVATMYVLKKVTVDKYKRDFNLFPKTQCFKDAYGEWRVTPKGAKTFYKRLKAAKQTKGGMKKWMKNHAKKRIYGRIRTPRRKIHPKKRASLSNKPKTTKKRKRKAKR